MYKSNYISEIDELLLKLEKEFPQKSASRILEEEKCRKVAFLRDHVNSNDQSNSSIATDTSTLDLTEWI